MQDKTTRTAGFVNFLLSGYEFDLVDYILQNVNESMWR